MRLEQFAALCVIGSFLLATLALAAPTPSGNLSAFASPTTTPTPAPALSCSVTVVDNSLAVPNSSSSGTVTVPAAALHSLTVTLNSSQPTGNTASVNGVQPATWGNLPAGANITKVVDITGLWIFSVTTPGCPANSTAVLAY